MKITAIVPLSPSRRGGHTFRVEFGRLRVVVVTALELSSYRLFRRAVLAHTGRMHECPSVTEASYRDKAPRWDTVLGRLLSASASSEDAAR